jgi:hypothetical protein
VRRRLHSYADFFSAMIAARFSGIIGGPLEPSPIASELFL